MELSSWIGAAEWAAFKVCYERRRWGARFSTPEPGRFQALWSEWELTALCRLSRAPQDEGFRLFTRGRMVMRDAYLDKAGDLRADVLQKLWASGVSITVRRLESYSNAVLALTRSLEAALGCPVQVNLYLTPGEGQALGAHFDDHDVLVLQIQGRKTWEIYADPDRAGDAGDGSLAAPVHTDTPFVRTLEAGGWLYLPKGIRHEVRNNAAEPSVHFTVSFHPLTRGRMIRDTLDRALQGDPSFDAPCPAGVPVSAAEIERSLAALQVFFHSPDIYYRGFRNLSTPVPAAALGDRRRLETADATTRFVWRADEVSIGGGGGELDLAYRRHALELRSDLGAVAGWMAGRGAFCATELESVDRDTALLLCKFLASVGVLRWAEDDERAPADAAPRTAT